MLQRFEQKLRKIKFPTKNSVEAYLYVPQEWRLRLQRFDVVILLSALPTVRPQLLRFASNHYPPSIDIGK